MNNRMRPESNGETVVDATEADTGAAVMMQIMKLIADGEPVAFNDVRYCHDDEVWDFNNSGSLAPYFAHRRHDTLEGTEVYRQPPMYFPRGGGTCRVIAAPGEITWGRVLIKDSKPYLVAGRGEVVELPDDEVERRARLTDYTWPHAFVRLRCPRDYFMATFSCNHAHFIYGDHLGALKAVADELGLETVVMGA
jgi:L-fucose isomerase